MKQTLRSCGGVENREQPHWHGGGCGGEITGTDEIGNRFRSGGSVRRES
jgi:hypothetical protein